MAIEMRAPGLRFRNRGGKTVGYWICQPQAVKKGYPVKTQRLWSGDGQPTNEDMDILRRECHRLQGEVKGWMAHPGRKKPKSWRAWGSIYFLRRANEIKIGFASNAQIRLSQLQVSSPDPLELLGTIPGNREIERHLHWQFRASRIRGEWFSLSDDLRQFIERNISGTSIANGIANVRDVTIKDQGVM